ncbi:MAG: hypothetical protein HQM10_04075 [Candidatus Riflebacteria bacterium]|nr:hypothetical protein [Candidatus Riflebacteria bacterium]
MQPKYNPHSLQKFSANGFCRHSFSDFFIPMPPDLELADDLAFLAINYWKGIREWYLPKLTYNELSSEFNSEYASDACRIALLTCVSPPIQILNSSFKWLSAFYSKFMHHSENLSGKASQINSNKNFDLWLSASKSIYDHLVTRKRPYTAFSIFKKAFHACPVNSASEKNEKLLVLTLLLPFAPVLAMSLLISQCEISDSNPSTDSIDKLVSSFCPRKAVCISVKNGKRSWEVFNENDLRSNPSKEISKIPWVKKSLKNLTWQLVETNDGWMICL